MKVIQHNRIVFKSPLEILETVNKMQIYKDDDADWRIVTGVFLNIELTKEKKIAEFLNK